MAIGQALEASGFDSLWTVEHVARARGLRVDLPVQPERQDAGPGRLRHPRPAHLADLRRRPHVAPSASARASSSSRSATRSSWPRRSPRSTASRADGWSSASAWAGSRRSSTRSASRSRTAGRRTDDHVAVLRSLWAEGEASHDSEYTKFTNAYSRPRPTQANIPIVVGGHSKAAARRAGRLGDGFFPGKGTHEELAELIAVMRATAVEHGRDPDAIEVSAGGNGALGPGALDEVKALADLGVDARDHPAARVRPRGAARGVRPLRRGRHQPLVVV